VVFSSLVADPLHRFRLLNRRVLTASHLFVDLSVIFSLTKPKLQFIKSEYFCMIKDTVNQVVSLAVDWETQNIRHYTLNIKMISTN
jgi:hypothetical protein